MKTCRWKVSRKPQSSPGALNLWPQSRQYSQSRYLIQLCLLLSHTEPQASVEALRHLAPPELLHLHLLQLLGGCPNHGASLLVTG